jgi:RNA polymerase primary sigma factor
MLNDLARHDTFTREEELARTTELAAARRVVESLIARRNEAATSLAHAQRVLSDKVEIFALVEAGAELEPMVRLCLDTEARSEVGMPDGHVARWHSEIVELDRQIEQARRRAKAVRDDLISHNYRLVLHFARRTQRMAGPRIDFEDLVMQGVCGMIEALDRFDPTRGARFGTYAALYIRSRLSEFSLEQKGPIRVPLHRHRQLRAVSRIRVAYASEHGRAATEDEVARVMGMAVLELSSLLALENLTRPASIDRPTSPEPDADCLGASLADPGAPSPEDVAIRHDEAATMSSAITRLLGPRERLVLHLRFGLGDEPRVWTLEDVGRLLGVTRERVRQIEGNALLKLRRDELVRDLEGW